MKTIAHMLLLLSLLVDSMGCASSSYKHALAAIQRKPLSSEQQELFLSKYAPREIMGNFDTYCSLLYATFDVAIHTESQAINHTDLSSPFPDFYTPTWGELFDTIARQTRSSCKYDASRDFWVFGAPSKPLCFDIKVSDGWKAHDEGLFVGYKPSIAPVGLDVYVLGRYSATNQTEEAALFNRVREAIAIQLATNFKKDVSARDMEDVAVGNLRALHFQATGPTGVIWRQWVVVDSGMAFAIVSAIKPEHEKNILPDVLKMVASFKIVESTPKSEQGGAGSRLEHYEWLPYDYMAADYHDSPEDHSDVIEVTR